MNYPITRQLHHQLRPPRLPTSFTRRLPPSPHAPAEARRALDRLRPVVVPDCLDDIRLLVTELVTNSYRHAPPDAGAPIDLHVCVGHSTVRVEVRDGGWGFTPPPAPDLPEEGGRGLYLVGQMADRWGVRQEPTTCVWFEMDVEKPWQQGGQTAHSTL
ncbi:MAG TPA: ATP-binding protein [Actinomycetota bacterium]|nr:ATP-binding protein [Actinomycetota bacterium]